MNEWVSLYLILIFLSKKFLLGVVYIWNSFPWIMSTFGLFHGQAVKTLLFNGDFTTWNLQIDMYA